MTRTYIPVRPGHPGPPATPDAAQMKIIPPDLGYISAHREEIKQRFTAPFGAQ